MLLHQIRINTSYQAIANTLLVFAALLLYSNIICMRLTTFSKQSKTTVAGAGVVEYDKQNKLPRVAIVEVNAKYSGSYSRYYWSSILPHEFSHALARLSNRHVFSLEAL